MAALTWHTSTSLCTQPFPGRGSHCCGNTCRTFPRPPRGRSAWSCPCEPSRTGPVPSSTSVALGPAPLWNPTVQCFNLTTMVSNVYYWRRKETFICPNDYSIRHTSIICAQCVTMLFSLQLKNNRKINCSKWYICVKKKLVSTVGWETSTVINTGRHPKSNTFFTHLFKNIRNWKLTNRYSKKASINIMLLNIITRD